MVAQFVGIDVSKVKLDVLFIRWVWFCRSTGRKRVSQRSLEQYAWS